MSNNKTITPTEELASGDALTEEQREQLAVEKISRPVCPHCGTEKGQIAVINITIGNMSTLMFYCGTMECRKIINCQAIGPAPDAKRIITKTNARIHRPS